jgi:predicted DNA-binding transcriptional regulator YafY
VTPVCGVSLQPSSEQGEGCVGKLLYMSLKQEVDQLLRNAIADKHLIRFQYRGKERIVEPHDYGVNNGIVRLFSWQVGGRSSGQLPGWRMFDVEGIENCEILEKHFPGNRDVSGKHHHWDEIFIRVEPPRR